MSSLIFTTSKYLVVFFYKNENFYEDKVSLVLTTVDYFQTFVGFRRSIYFVLKYSLILVLIDGTYMTKHVSHTYVVLPVVEEGFDK